MANPPVPTARPERRPTIADVARAAGVSASTASLAFNRSGPVAETTRARILAAAADLGYRGPDPLARSLRRGRCGVVAVAIGERLGYAFSDPTMVTTLDGLAEEVGAMGSSLMLVPGHGSDGAPIDGGERVDRLASLPMDAAVLLDCYVPGPALGTLRARDVALVAIDGPVQAGLPLVGIDDEGGTRQLVEHLAGLGHRILGVVTLPLAAGHPGGRLPADDPVSAVDPGAAWGVPLRRIRATVAALRELPGRRAGYVAATGNGVSDGARAAGELLDSSPRPTALIAQSDVLALGCLQAAADRGLTVPGDLSVAGFDGVDLHLFDGTELTTIVQPATEKGRAAGRAVAAALAGERPQDVLLPIRLRIGSTTGPAPRD